MFMCMFMFMFMFMMKKKINIHAFNDKFFVLDIYATKYVTL